MSARDGWEISFKNCFSDFVYGRFLINNNITKALKNWKKEQISALHWTKTCKQRHKVIVYEDHKVTMGMSQDEGNGCSRLRMRRHQVETTTGWDDNRLRRQQVETTTDWDDNRLRRQQVETTAGWDLREDLLVVRDRQAVWRQQSTFTKLFLDCHGSRMWHKRTWKINPARIG
jgi:hypothetical protein